MIDMTFFCQGESRGLVAFDSNFSPKPMSKFLSSLNTVLDPEGETDVASGSAVKWSKTYSNSVKWLRDQSHSRFNLVVCGEFFPYYVSIRDNGLTHSEKQLVKETFTEQISLPSGKLMVADAIYFFETGRDIVSKMTAVEIVAGDYTIEISHLHVSPSVADEVGFFDQRKEPTVVLNLQVTKYLPEISGPYPILTGHQEEAFLMLPRKRCYARVSRIDDDVVTMKLLLTPKIEGGYGRMKASEAYAFQRNQVILVELVEDKRNFWIVKFISAV